MTLVADKSVHLIVTSPPYWQLKDYGTDAQIGFNDSYEQYINNLNLVWAECHRVLADGCRLCINIGDQFARSVYYGRYKVIPIHSEIIRFCETIGFDFMGSIVWQKPTNMHTTGGQKVMGSYPFPRGGIVKIDFEHILLFKKQGKAPGVSKEIREASALSHDEWDTYFSSHWSFPGAKQDGHIAVFPEELPRRVIKMFSFVGDIVLDPFMGSGTTALAARNLDRSSIGYEINPNFKRYYWEKVMRDAQDCDFVEKEDNSPIDFEAHIKDLAYRFVDVHKLDKQVDVKQETYGSVMEDKKILQQVSTDDEKLTVLVNHARNDVRHLMIEKGICYLRAGDSKGSVLVTPGFEQMQYLLLHTSGRDCQLFRLKAKGKFQIWTKETLEQHGFSPQHASYYIVLHFDSGHPIELVEHPDIKEQKNIYLVNIQPFSKFKIK